MKSILTGALGLAVAASTFGAVIDISTGTGNAAWQIIGPAFSGAAVDITGNTNAAWAPAPAGTSWVSWGTFEGVSCTTAATGPANSCASTLSNPNGDLWAYTLTLSAAQLGATSGSLNFIFGSDNRVNVFVGNEPVQNAGGFAPTGTGYNPLSCSSPGGATVIAGNVYSTCTSTITFGAGDLMGDGSLVITAYNYNDPNPTPCPTCGNPTGFILDGTLSTGSVSSTPEPATFGLVGLAGLAGGAILRRRNKRA